MKRIIGSHPLTVVDRRRRRRTCARRRRQRGRRADREGAARADGGADAGLVNAIDLKGLPLGEARFAFNAGAREADAAIDLPVEIRNDVARLDIAGERSAGAVQLLDKRWRRRTVGIISGSDRRPLAAAARRDLLSVSARLTRLPMSGWPKASAPAVAVTRFLDQHLPMLILADVGNVARSARRLDQWIDNGGVLVRFAGPHARRRHR